MHRGGHVRDVEFANSGRGGSVKRSVRLELHFTAFHELTRYADLGIMPRFGCEPTRRKERSPASGQIWKRDGIGSVISCG